MNYTPDSIYNDLLREMKRIFGKEIVPEDKQFIFRTFIYDKIQNAYPQDKPESTISHTLREWLTLKPILDQALKILAIMKDAKSWPEFELLAADPGSPKV